MKPWILVFVLFFTALQAHATDKESQEGSVGPLQALSHLVGQWQGPSWYMTREGRKESTVTETVSCRWDCELIVIEGRGESRDAGGQPVVAHQALGVIHFDKKQQSLMMRAYAQGRGATDSALESLGAGRYRWFLSLPHNSGQIRYTLDLSAPDVWAEIGEFSRDGGEWHTIMEMTLKRVP